MATLRWESGAFAIAQVNTWTFAGTWEATDINRVQVGNKIKDTVTGSTVIATIITTLETALEAVDDDDWPELLSDESGVTITTTATTMVFTANEPGVPFTATFSMFDTAYGAADAQTIEGAATPTTGTATTVNSGPNVYDTLANWDSGALPVDADTIIFENADESAGVLYGLDQSAIEPAAVYVMMSFEAPIGLAKTNTLGTEYPEYRSDYLTIGPVILDVGRGQGSGSGRLKFNSGTDPCAVTVHNTGSPEEANVPAFLWKGTDAGNTFTARGNASCGIAFFGGETATVATLTLDGNASVVCGLGVTLTTINVNGGRLEVNSNIAGTITVRGGEVTLNGTTTVAQMTVRGGRVVVNSSGTWAGNTILAGDGVLDFSEAPVTLAITNPIEMYGPNCRIIDPNKRITTLVVDLNEGADAGQIVWGVNVRLSRGTPA